MNDILEYKIGDKSKSGNQIKEIIHCTDSAIVFISDDDILGYECFGLTIDISKAIDKFVDLESQISRELPETLLKRIRTSLGSALFHALIAGSVEESLQCFVTVEKRIKKLKTPNQAKTVLILLHLIFTFLALLISMAIYILSPSPYNVIFLCIGMGSFGSLFSSLQRSSEIHLNLTGGISYTVMQAAFVTVLGGMSGFVMYVTSHSDIAFIFAKDNVHTLALMSILAGFSERLVPDLFIKIEKGSS